MTALVSDTVIAGALSKPIGLMLRAHVKTKRKRPVVLPVRNVRYRMVTAGWWARRGQGGWRPEARAESGGTSLSSKRADGLRGRR